MRGVYSQAHPSRASPVPSQNFFKKSQTFFQKPLDKTYLLCYTISVNRRGPDHLPLKLSLKVCSLSPMVFLSHRSLSEGLFANHLLYMVSGWWCSRLPQWFSWCFPFLTAWRVAKAREYTHANKAVGRLTVDRHWQLGNRRVSFLSSSSSTV